MLKIFQKKQLKKKIDYYLQNRDVSGLNDTVVTIGFLVDEDMFPDFDNLKSISEKNGLQEKDMVVFTFMNVKKKLPTLRQNMINNKNFTWKGEIKNQNANEFLNRHFDVLVGYYQGNNLYLDLMMAKSKAKFKVGFKDSDLRILDLIIDVNPQKPAEFKRELLKYLRALGKI